MKLWFFNKDQKPGKILSNTKDKMPKGVNVRLPRNVNITDFLQMMMKIFSSPPSGPTGPRVHMKFPYTFSAKLAQFPFRFYYQSNWIFRYLPWGFVSCMPFFWYMSSLANSEGNKAKWKEIRRLEEEHQRHKFD